MPERLIVIKGKFVDETKTGMADLQRRLDMLEQRLGKTGTSAKKASGEFEGLVGEQTGKKLGRFNERTEKGRQLLVAFGGAAGGAAGQVVYYGGTLASVVGTFSKFELGVMGGVAAVAALGWALINKAQEPARKAKEGMAALNKELGEYIENAEKASETVFLSTLSDQEKLTRETRAQLQAADQKMLKQVDYLNQLKQERSQIREMGRSSAGRAAQLDKQIKAQERQIGYSKIIVSQLKTERSNLSLITASKEKQDALDKKAVDDQRKQEAEQKRIASEQEAARKRRIEQAKREAEQERNRLELQGQQIAAIKSRGVIERELDEMKGTAIQKQIVRLEMLRAIEGDPVKRAQIEFDAERARIAAMQEGIELEKNSMLEYREWQAWHEQQVTAIKKRESDNRQKLAAEEARNNMRLLQAGVGGIVALVQAAEEGRLKEMAKSSALQAIQQWALYFGALAFGSPQAPIHMQSAIMHTAFAAAAGIGSLAQSGGGGGGGMDNGSSVTQATATGGVQSEQPQQDQNVVYIGNFFESEDASRELAARVESANTRDSFRGL
jgi:hypothetical protein